MNLCEGIRCDIIGQLFDKLFCLLFYVSTLWVFMKVAITFISSRSREKLEKQRNAHELAVLQAGGKLKQEETHSRNAHEKEMYELKNKPQ